VPVLPRVPGRRGPAEPRWAQVIDIEVLRKVTEVLLPGLASRRKGSVGAGIPAGFTGHLMTDGYTGYQHLLDRIAGIQQCCQHVIRRCRAVEGLGPGSLQSWAADIIAVLAQAHRAVEDARSRGDTALNPKLLADLRERRNHRTRRRPRRHRGKSLATTTSRSQLTPILGTP
jgi:hypothetical protein